MDIQYTSGNPHEEKSCNQQNDAQIHVIREMEVQALMSLFTYCIYKN